MKTRLASTWLARIWGFVVALVLGMVPITTTPQSSDEIEAIRTASLRTRLGGEPDFSAPRQVNLPFRWDVAYPLQSGEMWFEITVPPAMQNTGVARALYAPRLGNRSELFFGEQLLFRIGIGEKWANYGRQPQLILLPQSNTAAPTVLRWRVEADAQARSGLGAVFVGPLDVMRERAGAETRLRVYFPLVSMALLVGLSAVGLLVYLRTREILYLLFVGFTLGWVARLVMLRTVVPLVPPPVHLALLNTTYLFLYYFIVCFMVRLFERDLRWHAWRLGLLYVSLIVATFASTLLFGSEVIYTSALFTSLAIGLVYAAWAGLLTVQRVSPERGAFMLAFAIGVVAATRDFVAIRLGSESMGGIEWSPLAAVGFALVLGAILAYRYVQSIEQYRVLNNQLANRIATREAQLTAIHAAEQTKTRASASEVAVREERGRIMRDMHDGLGAKLVTMLNTLQSGKTTQADLSAQVRESLDELRLTIDSLEDSEGDLTSVLGHLRFRLDKRFTEAGIRFDWRVAPLPALSILTPANVQHVQRLLLEVFTNILKHAHATCVTVSTEEAADGVTISIADDGVGFNPEDSNQQHGRGMANMQFRANALGGTVKTQSPCASSGTGTQVRLWLPLLAG